MKARVHLPVVESAFESSLDANGSRKLVYPADVTGKLARARKVGFALLLATWIALPLVHLNGHPLVLLDVARRRFFLFGAVFNAQDAWLVFFLLTGAVFALAVATSIAGRVFCGFACPQTVFLDAIFRPIERFVEGPRDKRIRRDAGPPTWERAARKVAKHALYLVAAFVVAHVALSFFVPLPTTIRMIASSPAEHSEAFAWAAVLTLLVYGNFAWFREQLCLVVCPYGRLQASLVDDDTLVIGYDAKRGEPRGKLHASERGDCIDCRRCVVVCPTGIDIRNGLQLDCIGCTACIDACDEIMGKIGKPPGLVRFASSRSLAGEKTRFWRPRLTVYALLAVAGLAASSLAFRARVDFEANLVRAQGTPFVVEDGRLRNSFTLHVVNKSDAERRYSLTSESPSPLDLSVSPSLVLGPGENTMLPLVVAGPSALARGAQIVVRLRAHDAAGAVVDERVVRATMVGPSR